MREFFRTEEGSAAWRNPATDAQTRRLLGALVQPQPEEHLKLVLGPEGQILLDSLERRGWVASRPVQEPEAPPYTTDQPSQTVSGLSDNRVVNECPTPPVREQAVIVHNSTHYLPPMTPPPKVSEGEVQSSLDEFFRKMGN